MSSEVKEFIASELSWLARFLVEKYGFNPKQAHQKIQEILLTLV